MAADHDHVDYQWSDEDPHTQLYLLAPLQDMLCLAACPANRVLDLGCGNGSMCQHLRLWGYNVVGVDPSANGISKARQRLPEIEFLRASAKPADLAALPVESFDIVISTEVVEHCYSPRDWAASAFMLLRPGGLFVCSAPYHGYLKNVALALSGKLDNHFTALWDGGHIKFWSRRTLSHLLIEAGFVDLRFRGAGRFPWFWKSMLIAARKPSPVR